MSPVYVINLARRPDRLASIKATLDRGGLSFTRIDAVDAQSCDPDWLEASFAAAGPLGSISPGAKACTLSHFRAYETFLSSPDAASASHAIILEDDVHLTEAAAALLSDLYWLPAATHLLKLERSGTRAPPVLLGRTNRIGGAEGPLIASLFSEHLGSAGYVISRSAAAAIVAINPKPMLAIDHLLFDPVRSPAFGFLRPVQLLPALFRQESPKDSDVCVTDPSPKISRWILLRKEIARLRRQVRWLPHMIAAVCFEGAWFVSRDAIGPLRPAAAPRSRDGMVDAVGIEPTTPAV
jgi:glycosyl transferase family 25